MLNVVFRTDASLDIGTGHVMRCLTLATVLRDAGADCVFVCRKHIGNLIETIRGRGFKVLSLPAQQCDDRKSNPVISLNPQYSTWLGADWQTDAETTLAAVQHQSVDWIVVDHYAIDVEWEAALRPFCGQIMVIDDLADRSHDCDVLLDQNLGREVTDYDDLVPENCIRLIGPQFALLRPEFAALRDYSLSKRSPPLLKHLLISMGGVDRDNTTSQILEALKKSSLPENCSISIVMGRHAPWLETVRQSVQTMPWRSRVLVDTSDMAQLMADSDLAIGAAGATAWERCCLGLPSLMLILADNQKLIANALNQLGAARSISLGSLNGDINNFVNDILAKPQLLLSASKIAATVTDGCGASRVVGQITRGAE